jgi:hypothetical protein
MISHQWRAGLQLKAQRKKYDHNSGKIKGKTCLYLIDLDQKEDRN